MIQLKSSKTGTILSGNRKYCSIRFCSIFYISTCWTKGQPFGGNRYFGKLWIPDEKHKYKNNHNDFVKPSKRFNARANSTNEESFKIDTTNKVDHIKDIDDNKYNPQPVQKNLNQFGFP
ncbi:hypothetical protein CEXT_441421 [Caerostris extrusa]|uniref:Uncharacterized protein n=1 Tax=Caerostris extrusa TaxID=172846 RepID=A0AAV4Q5M5_CAEEX|nr:hypothetical protein CEXT_441421 [Caerostris extrusa]